MDSNSSDEEEIEIIKEIEEDINLSSYFIEDIIKETRFTCNYLTKFEKAQVLSIRTEQLIQGDKPKVQVNKNEDPLTIAKMELASKKIDMVIRRPLSQGRYEDWKVSELIILKD